MMARRVMTQYFRATHFCSQICWTREKSAVTDICKKKIPNHTFPSHKLDKKGQNENYCTVNTIVGVISINTLLQYCKYQTKNENQKSS